MVYKLFYFPIKALAEPIRFILSYGNIEFEDHRIAAEDWPKHKDSMPMGQMPVLEVDGKQMFQSMAICRFLAKKVGIAGQNDLENYEIDNVVEIVNDLRAKIGVVSYEKDVKVQEEKRKLLNSETIPFYLNKLDEIAKNNNGHLALKRTTWADLYFVGLSDYLNFMSKQDLTAKHANLKKVVDNVLAIESIKKWVAKRPKSDA